MARDGGVYEIANRTNGKRYIGSSINVPSRIKEHLSKLEMGAHPNSHLQAAWKKYGSDAFICRQVLCCERHHLLELEQILIDSTPSSLRYNLVDKAGSVFGCRHSEESRAKAGRKIKALWAKPENRTRFIAAANLRWRDQAYKARMVEANRAAQKAFWADPIRSAARREQIRQQATGNKQLAIARSIASKAMWADPVRRQALLEARTLARSINKQRAA